MVDVKATYEYTKDLSVLYVEDNESVRDASVSIFGEFFALVDSAIDGEDGINKYKEKLEAEGKSYDLVITDLNMPKVSGAELIELIHEINFEQSIVVVSAYNESHRLIELIDAGISHFIQKPIKPNQFINVAYKVAKNIVARSMLATQHQLTKNLNEDLESIVQKRTKELHLKNEELNYQLFMIL
jgi:YesN/AraC family two-component response regulator